MNDRAHMERGYRRLLACYPREFRQENEDEILEVLMATAAEGQRRVGLAEAADLVRGALRARLRPRVPWPPAVRAAVRLMCAGAVLELAVLVTFVMTAGSVRSAILVRYPGLTAAQWHAIVVGRLLPGEIGAPLAAGLWLWLAWGNGKGRHWARVVFAVFFGLSTLGMLLALAEDSAAYAPVDLAVGVALWSIQAAVMLLIFGGQAAAHFRPGLSRDGGRAWTGTMGTMNPPGVA